jgi:Predicted membrane protein
MPGTLTGGELDLGKIVQIVGTAVESIGMAVIVVGSLVALISYMLRTLRDHEKLEPYNEVRRDVGRALLLGIEFLVAGDIIRTVGGKIGFQSLGLLAGVVAIRTFLSFTITAEIEGRWPWQIRD